MKKNDAGGKALSVFWLALSQGPKSSLLPCFAPFCREMVEYLSDQVGGFLFLPFRKWMPQLVLMGEGPIDHVSGGNT